MVGGDVGGSGQRHGTDDWLINSHSFQQLSGRVKCLYLYTWLPSCSCITTYWMKQSEGNTDLQKSVCSPRGCTIWHEVSGVESRFISCTQNAKRHKPDQFLQKLTKSGNIRGSALPSEVRRQAPFEWSSRFLWTFLSCFHIKRHERGSKKQDSQPPIPLPWVTAVCSSHVLSRNNQDYRQSLTIKVSPSLSLMLPFCTLSLSVIKSWSSWWNAVLRMFTRKKACVSGYN